jgi:hypothetical protein
MPPAGAGATGYGQGKMKPGILLIPGSLCTAGAEEKIQKKISYFMNVNGLPVQNRAK